MVLKLNGGIVEAVPRNSALLPEFDGYRNIIIVLALAKIPKSNKLV